MNDNYLRVDLEGHYCRFNHDEWEAAWVADAQKPGEQKEHST
jgi:hypothetical protein